MYVNFSETKIKSPDLYRVVSDFLELYGTDVVEAVEEASQVTAKEIAKDLRSAAGNPPFKGGEAFKRGWDVRKEKLRVAHSTYTVYNKTKPGLAHLLEFGHAIAGGGRTKPRTRAFNFIAPIADTAEERFRNAFADAMAKRV